jgi:hypothetical protein
MRAAGPADPPDALDGTARGSNAAPACWRIHSAAVRTRMRHRPMQRSLQHHEPDLLRRGFAFEALTGDRRAPETCRELWRPLPAAAGYE